MGRIAEPALLALVIQALKSYLLPTWRPVNDLEKNLPAAKSALTSIARPLVSPGVWSGPVCHQPPYDVSMPGTNAYEPSLTAPVAA